MYSGEGVYGKGQSVQEKVCCGWGAPELEVEWGQSEGWR